MDDSLALDISGRLNVPTEHVAGAIAAAIAGDDEPIRSFGVLIDRATHEPVRGQIVRQAAEARAEWSGG